MDDQELVRRVLSLSPSRLQRIKAQLNKPKKPTSSKVEELTLTAPYQDCGSCGRATVRQSGEDYHVLENSCIHLKSREWDENRRRAKCAKWSMKRKGFVEEEVKEE